MDGTSANPRPRNGYVFLRAVAEDEPSGLILPPSATTNAPVRGIVVYACEQMQCGCEVDLRPGDEVLFFRQHANEVKLPGSSEQLLLIHEQHIIAVSDPAPAHSPS